MNIKSTLITVAVKILAEKTDLIQKQTPTEEFFTALFGGKTQEQRLAESIESVVDKTTFAASRVHVNRKFKKIVQNAQ